MAGTLNRVQLIGYLGRDPEIRTSQQGDDIANLSIATSETWKDKTTGERKERTEWHRVVIFNPHLAGVAREYLAKGGLVYLEGQLQTRKYTGQDNVERYSTEIVLPRFGGELKMLGGRSEGGGNRPPPATSQDDYGRTRPANNTGRSSGPASSGGFGSAGGGFGGVPDDEIPF